MYGARQVRWAADRIDGVTTLVEVDEATGTATIIEVGAGVVRVRVGELTPGGVRVLQDATLESLCEVEPLPILGGDDDGGGQLADVVELFGRAA